MIFKILYIGLVVFLIPSISIGQEQINSFEELLVELLGEDLSEETDLSEVIERLNYYQRHPIDLNKADASQLSDLVFLNAQQIYNILEHRQVSGNYISLLELQAVRGLNAQIIQFLTQFVTVGSGTHNAISLSKVWKDSEQSVLARYGRTLEKPRGYSITDSSRSRYLGDPNRYALRYKLNHENKLKISLNAEKDAGEAFFKEKQRYGFDFYSGSMEWNRSNRILQKVILGDYALQFGQGLIAWNGLSFGKGASLQSIARQAQGIRQYSSLNEYNYMRGIAFDFKWNKISWKPFLAYNTWSGKVEQDTNGHAFITTINESGLHRTPTEQSYRKQIGHWVGGSNIQSEWRGLKVGMTYMFTRFRGDIQRGDELRQQYDFQGSLLQQLGVHYQYSYRNYFLYGETAFNEDLAWATSNGVIAALDPKVSLFLHYRNYQKNYHQYYARAIGESSNVSNERGVLAGLQYQLIRKLEWMSYVDFFQFPWLRYRVDAPSTGIDLLSQLTYTWYKKGKLSFRYRYRLKEENVSIDKRADNFIAQVFRNQLRGEFQYKLNNVWNIRSRIEWSRYDKEYSHTSQGYLLYQDIFWKGNQSDWSSNIRVAYFHTTDYDSRIYAYESDVLYGASFPMYYDHGWRYYVNLRYRIRRGIDIWTRYAQTIYTSRENVGSGLDLIDGNKKSEIKVQLRWQW